MKCDAIAANFLTQYPDGPVTPLGLPYHEGTGNIAL
jgi:hypothetical protein